MGHSSLVLLNPPRRIPPCGAGALRRSGENASPPEGSRPSQHLSSPHRGDSVAFAGITRADHRYQAGNGEIIASSEGYKTKASALNGIESVKKNSVDAAVVDLSE